MLKQLRHKLVLLSLLALISACSAKDEKMKKTEFQFDLGNTLAITEGQIPLKLSGQNAGGLVIRGADGLQQVHAKYVHDARMISFGPIFGFLLTADENRKKPAYVDEMSFTIDADFLTAHAEAYEYVNTLMTQFKATGWKRYLPEVCPRLTGWSSVRFERDVDRLISSPSLSPMFPTCGADPDLSMTLQEWTDLFGSAEAPWYQWIADGRIATLKVQWTTYPMNRAKPIYSIGLQFELEESMKHYDAINRELHAKDRGGMDVLLKDEAERDRIKKVLEEQAMKRGERLFLNN